MIESIEFSNFKVLRQAKLPLVPFTLLVGPNGSGKSTVLQALSCLAAPGRVQHRDVQSVGSTSANGSADQPVQLLVRWRDPEGISLAIRWSASAEVDRNWRTDQGNKLPPQVRDALEQQLASIRIYALDPGQLANDVHLQTSMELKPNGAGLAAVLDRLRDRDPERFERLNQELGRFFPEFDRVLFDTPSDGHRSFGLRVRGSHQAIPARDLSQGTLLALAILTLAYLPEPPSLVGLEEPDRGIHPRLLRSVRDALYRLSYPESCGETRPAVQVVATTHSPYFLDLFKDHPEEIVIAQKSQLEARFEPLAERPDMEEILSDAPLGEVWYSGVLGGVPGTP